MIWQLLTHLLAIITEHAVWNGEFELFYICAQIRFQVPNCISGLKIMEFTCDCKCQRTLYIIRVPVWGFCRWKCISFLVASCFVQDCGSHYCSWLWNQISPKTDFYAKPLSWRSPHQQNWTEIILQLHNCFIAEECYICQQYCKVIIDSNSLSAFTLVCFYHYWTNWCSCRKCCSLLMPTLFFVIQG